MMKPISNSVFAENFPNEAHSLVSMLDAAEAKTVFASAFGSNVSHFFDFPDDHWIASGDSKDIGGWVDAYNNNHTSIVSGVLENALDWNTEDVVFYLIGKTVVLAAKWRDFLRYWDSFIASDSDASILMRRPSEQQEALIFMPRGRICYVTRRRQP